MTATDFEAALHNFRRDPSPDNLRALMRSGEVVCTHLRRLDEQLERALERTLELERERDRKP